MKPVYVLADNIVSPIGFSSEENFSSLLENKTALQPIDIINEEFTTYASVFNKQQLDSIESDTAPGLISRYERILYKSLKYALSDNRIDSKSEKTIFIFATTKGNIELIEKPETDINKLKLYYSAQKITALFGNPNKPLVISNACISGLAAIITASRLLSAGYYENAVVCGADTVNNFVLSGFQSLKALSAFPCRPFDINRTGVNLGEAASTLILSVNKKNIADGNQMRIAGGAITNDANHISGPSRTGEELALAINIALIESGLESKNTDLLNAHGTATSFNDEMEAKAITISGLHYTPVNSLKAYYGHTLGVAGLLESIITLHSLKKGIILKSKGYEQCGTSLPLNICTTHINKNITTALKITAGFGGCNAALVLVKN